MSRRKHQGKKGKRGRKHPAKSPAISSRQAPPHTSGRFVRYRFALPCLLVLVLVIPGIWIALNRWNQTATGLGDTGGSAARTDYQSAATVLRGAGGVERGLEEQYRKLDASKDGWDTEVLSEQIGAQLKLFGKLLAHSEDLDEEHVSKLVSAKISFGDLRPKELDEVFEDESVVVFRGKAYTDASTRNSSLVQSVSGLVTALGDLVAPFDGADDIHVKYKIVHIDMTATTVSTSAYFQASGRPVGGAVQQNAVWHCTWTRPKGDEPPLLEKIRVEAFEEVSARDGRRALFADCTEAILGDNESFQDQLLLSIDHWRATIEWAFGVPLYGHQGLAVGDVNGDGLDDLFVCQPGGVPNRLFVRNPDGTALDVSAESGVDYLDFSRSALIIDLDNDGDQDLIVATSHGLLMMSNDGLGRFSLAKSIPGTSWTSLSAADYDNDGDLDVYACRYLLPDRVDQLPYPYHDANNAPPNQLFRNDGDWRFTEIAKECGLDVNNRRFSFASSWEDYDNDGDLDLYVANDFGRNNLYRNDGGYFRDVAGEAGVEDLSAGMAVSWGDYNNDGLMDIHVSNMFSSAGQRVTYQRRFKPKADQQAKYHFQRHARGNSLFENAGDGTFRDVSVEAAITMGRWAWGSLFVDINNDGLEDIVVANGYVTNDDTKDL